MEKIVVEVILTQGVITPDQVPGLLQRVEQALPAGGPEAIVISGRLPIWAVGALLHLFHPRPCVATFDPRLNAGVVVQTHTPGVRVGDLIPLDGGAAKKLEIHF